jgi:hypothetical protein
MNQQMNFSEFYGENQYIPPQGFQQGSKNAYPDECYSENQSCASEGVDFD